MHPLIPYFEPYSLQLGPIAIHGFGILVMIGFLVGGHIAQQKAGLFTGDRRAPDRINRLVGWLVLATFIGGHLGDVLWYHPQDLADDPKLFGQMVAAFASGRLPQMAEIPLILRVWEGLSSFGGFSVCVPLCIWFFRRERVNPWFYLDALAWGFAAGWFFGRMGCFSAHDHPGAQSDFWLAVPGMCPGNNPNVACHDLGLYEALWSGSMYLLFLAIGREPRFAGFYVAWIAMLYGPFRFVLDFWRSSPVDVRYSGLTPAQYGSVLVTLLGIWMLRSRAKAKVFAAPGQAATR